MKEKITPMWRPSKRTSETLKNSHHYTQEQLNRLGKVFVERYSGQEIDAPSSKFNKFVRDSEAPRNVPKPDNSAIDEYLKKREQALESKTPPPEQQKEGLMTREEALQWLTSQGRSFTT